MNMMSLKGFARAMRRRLRDEPHLRLAAARADAFLVSYPKSGRTWLRYLLSCYFAESARLGFAPDLTSTFRVLPNFDRDPVRGIDAFVGRSGAAALPLILVSHLPYRDRLFLDRPVLFLVRDPRDVIVSAYFHATRHKKSFSGDMAAFLDEPKYGMASLTGYLNGWSAGLEGRPHHLISYEHLLSEPLATVAGILAFLGVEPEGDILARAVAAAQFDRMRDKERGGGIPGHDYDRNDDQSLRMRSGKAGAFGEWLNPDQADLVLERCRSDLSPRALALLAATGVDLTR
ncbi:sulfotransferase domain-containing protein [Sphingobium sp. TB-6]|uniref:sulfotransferase domain-containing protein n=2 Tax=unclassified Sphingobium TaxID=2611147 RepID=UPI00077060D8|nr:sulfotransferase domain-containing protein [Sphingobium sp. TB-6]AMK25093.1 putative sulfotransferase protein [Sphingobium sp. TKS]NML90795.1 sulfotransferase domain-containing protein [Sphingobium sp. TB-6]